MEDIRWILLISGVILIAGIILYESYLKSFFQSSNTNNNKIEPTFAQDQSPYVSDEIIDKQNLSNKENINIEIQQEKHTIAVEAEFIVTIRMVAIDDYEYSGKEIVDTLKESGMLHEEPGIFNYYYGSNKIKVFSAANLHEPGIFDMNQLENLKVKGISFFMSLPLKTNEINAFDEMMSVLKKIKSSLKGELLDDNGSSLSIQRERYIREEVIEYSLKNQKKNHI
tara:strand:- start:86 stop:760 length:675 start_codon:yes stop_codon:yes gene_type:complete